MSKRVESIVITFENLDYVNILAEHSSEFYITSTGTTVERLALNAIRNVQRLTKSNLNCVSSRYCAIKYAS